MPEDTLLIFDDLLALEDRSIALQKLSSSKFFLLFEDLLKMAEKKQCLYWTKEPLSDLTDIQISEKVGRDFYSGKNPLQPLTFEIFKRTITSKRWKHPFLPVQGYLPNLVLCQPLNEGLNLRQSPEIEIVEEGGSIDGIHPPSSTTQSRELSRDPIPHLKADRALNRTLNLDIHFVCATESEEKSLQEKIALPKGALFERGYLSSGFALADSNTLIIPMTEFTHRYKVRREKWRSTHHTPASDFHELIPGDLIVHFQHGIGKYLGIEKQKNHTGSETEFLVLEYAEKSKLFVPIAQSYLVSRYIGAHEEIPSLHTLGTKNWQNTKAKAHTAIIGYAQDLLRLSAERTLHGGFSYPPDTIDMEQFEADFPYVETEDQLQAISAIKKDMESSKAMDRLICGDVGYGKTEVAIRAAFKAAYEGKKQVAVLVPTTVLALQHFETFCERLTNYPLIIRVLSRFQTPKEIKDTIKMTAEGKVDILVGTHRIISKDVSFQNLGLIIIDEEQRFGVRAKEHLKTLKTGVDCITLTATPIPRTLYLSLVGAREISIISTPPQDRLPIKSIIAERDPGVIQNALVRELSRDGQAFFIHNRVESIHQIGEDLKKLLPEAKIVIGHGQMSADELDTVFHAFKSGEADILLSTTIIENGIDIPNANTILIDRADQFGIADLYQLRGRVGRWNRPAYTYFLTPKGKTLTEHSLKRLHALVESQGYGGGMKIALRDLEMRGAGDILGIQQSGHIASIGFHLYCKLLKRTVAALQHHKDPSFHETKMEFPYDARLPDTYLPETSLRLEIYHRLGEVSTLQEIDDILDELKDRFGTPPPPVLWLYHLARIRLLASQKRYTLLKFGTYTLSTEKHQGKELLKETHSLKKITTPQELEKITCSVLK
ncbi:MAG: transcription-repair coupling factor [Rhabdochlamydiaceae bacterium]|jgi:transcription-repair coupling factor (superfamily II helicase)